MALFLRCLKRLSHWLLSPLRTNGAFFLWMFLLGIFCGYAELHNWEKAYDHLWAELFLDLYVICVLLSLLPERVRRWVRRALYVAFYALAVVDVYCFVKFQSTLNPTMLLLVGETNGKEAGEFLSAYVTADVLLSPVGGVLLLMVAHALTARFGCRLLGRLKRALESARHYIYSKVRARRIGHAAWLPTLKAGLPHLAALIVALLLAWSAAACWPNKTAMARLFGYRNIGSVEHELTRKDCAQLYAPPYRMAFSIYANRLTAKQIDRLLVTKNRVSVDSCAFTSPQIVLIIGESYNKHHSQLYGYDKPTTPRQLERRRRGELVAFDDVVAPWNLTSFVFKHLFSLYAAGDKGEWCDYPLFPEVFRQAGYHVTFLTNQFLPRAKDAVYDFSGGFFLNHPELSKAQFDVRNDRVHVFDEDLLDDYDRLQSRDHGAKYRGQLTIFHLYGQHVSYRIRCPKSRMKFKADDYDRPEMTARNRGILAYYDNSLLYNDSVVDAIVKRFEEKDAIVIYVPDHGEEVFGPGAEHFFGRMHSAEITARLAREEFEIPFWIWCSHRYMVNHPEIAHAIVTSRSRRFMTDALPHMLLYLAGIHTKDYRPELNVLSSDYDEQRPRIVKATADYDEVMNQE